MNPTHVDIIKQQVDRFVEDGAELEHARWARWQAHVFARATKNQDGSYTISASDAERWQRQIDADYKDLSEPEKESDRREAREYIPLITTAMHAAAHATEKAGEVDEKKHFAFECNGAHGGRGCYETFCEDKSSLGPCTSKEAAEVRAHNACRAQSRRQLDEYFGRNV